MHQRFERRSVIIKEIGHQYPRSCVPSLSPTTTTVSNLTAHGTGSDAGLTVPAFEANETRVYNER